MTHENKMLRGHPSAGGGEAPAHGGGRALHGGAAGRYSIESIYPIQRRTGAAESSRA